MRFTILAILWFTLYVALVLASLRYPTIIITTVVQFFSVASIAIAAVFAFDRRSTPAFAFVVFSIAAALNLEISSGVIFAMMSLLNITTGSVEYVSLQQQLYHHSMIATGLVGMAVGRIVQKSARSADQ